MPGPPDKKRYIRGLRLSKGEQEALLTHMDMRARSYGGSNVRRAERHNYRPEDGLQVQLFHPGGVEADLVVVPRNLSSSGVAFLHSSYVHLGTVCMVILQTVDGEIHGLRGEVIRCTHYRGNVHEVAVKFDDAITVGRYLAAYDGPTGQESLPVQLARKPDKVLYVEDSPDDADLVTFFLGKRGVDVHTVGTASDALNCLADYDPDVVLVDLNLPDMSGIKLIGALREKNTSVPIVVVTAEDAEDAQEKALRAGATAFLRKPFTQAALSEVLETHLPSWSDEDDSPEPIQSSMWSDREMRPLILRFLDRLEQKRRKLIKLLDAEDRDRLQQLCSEIKGSAKGFGYGQISRTAREVQQLATAGVPFVEMREQVQELAKLCVGARLGVSSDNRDP